MVRVPLVCRVPLPVSPPAMVPPVVMSVPEPIVRVLPELAARAPIELVVWPFSTSKVPPLAMVTADPPVMALPLAPSCSTPALIVVAPV